MLRNEVSNAVRPSIFSIPLDEYSIDELLGALETLNNHIKFRIEHDLSAIEEAKTVLDTNIKQFEAIKSR